MSFFSLCICFYLSFSSLLHLILPSFFSFSPAFYSSFFSSLEWREWLDESRSREEGGWVWCSRQSVSLGASSQSKILDVEFHGTRSFISLFSRPRFHSFRLLHRVCESTAKAKVPKDINRIHRERLRSNFKRRWPDSLPRLCRHRRQRRRNFAPRNHAIPQDLNPNSIYNERFIFVCAKVIRIMERVRTTIIADIVLSPTPGKKKLVLFTLFFFITRGFQAR